MNFEKILESVSKIDIYNTKLDNQILYFETFSDVIKTPMTIAILDSLIELRNIKRKQVEKFKEEQLKNK